MTRRSPHPFSETVSKLERAAVATGARLCGRIDHRAEAKRVGLALELTELLTFSLPEPATSLVRQQPTIGLDLPLKVLVWLQNDGVWLAYNDIGHIALRHGATKTPEPIIAMYDWFNALIEMATKP